VDGSKVINVLKTAFESASVAVLTVIMTWLYGFMIIPVDLNLVLAVIAFIALGLAVFKIKESIVIALAIVTCFSLHLITFVPVSPYEHVPLSSMLLSYWFGCWSLFWKLTNCKTAGQASTHSE
jgi:hypothetical protein